MLTCLYDKSFMRMITMRIGLQSTANADVQIHEAHMHESFVVIKQSDVDILHIVTMKIVQIVTHCTDTYSFARFLYGCMVYSTHSVKKPTEKIIILVFVLIF